MFALMAGLGSLALAGVVALISWVSDGDQGLWKFAGAACVFGLFFMGISWLFGKDVAGFNVKGRAQLSPDGLCERVGRDCEFVAHEGSIIEASYRSRVTAHSGALVYALRGSTVLAYAGSTVRARGGSRVEAYKGATVYAHEDSMVIAHEGSKVFAFDRANVHAHGGSLVTATAGAWVLPEEGAEIYTYAKSPAPAQDTRGVTGSGEGQ